MRKHPFFQDLSLDSIKQLEKNVLFKKLLPQEYLFHEGETAEFFYLIHTGKIAIEIKSPNNALTIQTLQDGDVLGWSWFIEPHIWKFDACAKEESEVFCFKAAELRNLCEKNHDFGYYLSKRLLQAISKRLEATRLQVLDIYAPHN